MERLTLDTRILFCDIAQCSETPGGSFCEDGYCDQRRCYERLREYERLGTIDDLAALVKARDDGRVVVLPCKVGETVWNTRWWDMVKEKCSDSKGKPFYRERTKNKITKDTYSPFSLDYFDFGKTVFLTRAEAEAALKGAVDHE